jgi:OmpA-OmpF porin, OOP family
MRTLRLISTSIVLASALAFAPATAIAQFGAIKDAARRAADAAKKDAEDAAKKKEKETPPTATPPAPASPPASAPAAAGTAPAATTSPAPAPTATAANAPSFAAYSKYDFVPGEKVVAADDFTQDEIGDFPARWNTNASGEIVTIAGKTGRWLKLTRAGFFIPEFITDLPDNVTVEFDLTVPPTFGGGFALTITLAQLANPKQPEAWQSSDNSFTFTAFPSASQGTSSSTTRQDGTAGGGNSATTPQLAANRNSPVHIALWRQRQRVRVYMNEEKVWDLPRASAASAKFNSLIFFVPGGCGNCEYYLSNLRVATGAPDTRNKILTEGKWISHGILFDVNSDRIKGESYGSLKEIATVLTENADLKVQIVGHTDSDGDDAANLDLSRRRAASVKTALSTQFGIDAGRMETDGKGESQPVDKNDNPAGKANNRRVEFIKK